MSEAHILENGKHLVEHIKRVPPFNVGEIAAYDPEIAAAMVTAGVGQDGRRIDPSGKYAARVMLKKEHDPIGAPGPKHKAGTIIAVSAERAATLVKAGEAEYVTPAHIEKVEAEKQKADRLHQQRMAESMAFAGATAAVSAPAKK